MKIIFSAFLILVLSGCETFGTRITDEQLTYIDKVGLVSLIDDQISYSYVGITVFNNKDTLYPFVGLNIDDYIVTNISSALRRANPRVEIIPIDVDFDEYRAAYTHAESIASLDVDSFVSLISEKASSLGLKYVIVASRDSIQFDEAPVSVNGFGLRKRIGQGKVGSFVLIKFQLVDLASKQVLAKARAFERDRESNFEWLEPFDENDDSQKSILKTYVYQSIDDWSRSVASTLIQSPEDFQICSEQVYSIGFEIEGTTYTTRNNVLEARGKYIRNKIMTEKVHPQNSKPPYEDRFNATEEKVLDCIERLKNNA